MDDFNLLPEADRYLAIILLTLPGAGTEPSHNVETMRGMAGLILKNNLRRRQPLPRETIQFMRSQSERLFAVLGDRMGLVRNTMGTLLASVASRLGRNLSSQWPELLPSLVQTATRGSSARETAEAAAEALAKICEDAADELVEDPSLPVPSLLLPCFLQLISSPQSEAVQVASLKAINCFIYQDDVLAAHLSSFLNILSELSSHPQASPRMKRAICQSLNLLMEVYPEEMRLALPSVLEYMLQMISLHRPDGGDDEEEAVALEAGEFWLSLAERDSAPELITPILPRLLPILIFNTIYVEDDPELLESTKESSSDTVDGHGHGRGRGNDNGFKPRHAQPSFRGKEDGEEGEIEADEHGNGHGEEDEEEEEDEERGEAYDLYGSWTIRKCSAATIDVMSSTLLERDLVPHLLPLINSYMAHSDWRHQEAGILVLGAISEGCSETVEPHLQQIVPFVVNVFLASPVPVVRAISLWMLGRYAASFRDNSSLQNQAFPAVLRAMADGNALVQKAACTALGVFAEQCVPPVQSHLMSTLEMCNWALHHYSHANLVNLLDALGRVASVGEEEGMRGALFVPLLPRLLQVWHTTAEQYDALLLALLECVCSILTVAGIHVRQHAPDVLERSLQMVQNALVKIHAALAEEEVRGEAGLYDVESESDVCMLGFDILGALTQGLREDSQPLFHSSPIQMETLLLAALDNESIAASVKQAAYALVGDLAIGCPSVLCSPTFLGKIVPFIARDMDVRTEKTTAGAANNAVWALGELVVRFAPQLSGSLLSLVASLCHLLGEGCRENGMGRGYLENVAVTLGRCLSVVPPPPQLASVLARWFGLLATVTNPDERFTAWLPMLNVLLKDPVSLLRPESILPLCQAVSVYRDPPPPLESALHSLLLLVRDRLVGLSAWPHYKQQHLSAIPDPFFARFSL